jgi:hypothetical protein
MLNRSRMNCCQYLMYKRLMLCRVVPLVHEPSALQAEMSMGNLKSYTSSRTDHITAQGVQAADKRARSEINKRISCIWNKETVSQQWKTSIAVHTYNKDNMKGYESHNVIRHKMLFNNFLSRLTPYI